VHRDRYDRDSLDRVLAGQCSRVRDAVLPKARPVARHGYYYYYYYHAVTSLVFSPNTLLGVQHTVLCGAVLPKVGSVAYDDITHIAASHDTTALPVRCRTD